MRNSHPGSPCCHYHCHHDQQQQYQGKLIPELAGAIFMCNNETRNESFRLKIFGLPACKENFVRQVKEGMLLFLFDTDNRRMYGVFEAISNGAMNIVPDAYSSSGRTYPAQVQFSIKSSCRPLTEPEFRSAILANYFTDGKFKFGLNFDQVQRLLVLFEEKKVRRVSQPIADKCFHRFSTSSPLDLVRNQTQSWYTGNAKSSQYTDDPAQRDVWSSSSHHLAQQQEQFGYCSGTGNCVVCSQKVLPDIVANSYLLDRTPCGLHVKPNNQQVTLSAYNHHNLDHHNLVSSQAAEVYYPENVKMMVDTSSKSQLRDQVYNSGSQDVEHRKSVFLRLARKRQREAWEEEPCQTVLLPAKSLPCDREARRPRCICDEQCVQGQEPFHIESALVVDGVELDTTVPVSTSPLRPGETQISIVNFERRNGGSNVSIELKGDKKNRSLVSRCPMNRYTEEDSDPDWVDGMVPDPTTAVSNLTVESCETQIPFVNFNRRNWGSKLSIEPKGDVKKRRLIRPSLELEDEKGHLQVGPMQVSNYFSESLKEPSLVDIKSGGENVEVANIIHVEAQVNSKSSENIQGSVGKSGENQPELKLVDTRQEGFQGHCEGERILGAIGIETERGKLESDTSSTAESSAPAFGQCRADINEILVFIESESNKLKQKFEEPMGTLFRSDTCLDKIPENYEVETRPDDPQMIVVSGCEKTDTFKLNEASATFSDCHPDLLVPGEKTNEMTSISKPESVASEPINEIEDSSGLEGEADNFKISTCLHNEKSNLVKECIAPDLKARALKTSPISHENSKPVEEDLTLESGTNRLEMGILSCQTSRPVEGEHDNSIISMCLQNENSNLVEECIPPELKARYINTSLVSNKEKNNPVKEDVILEPEADRLQMGLFSCQNNKPVEDFIPLESYDENSKETVEYLEITDRYFITVE